MVTFTMEEILANVNATSNPLYVKKDAADGVVQEGADNSDNIANEFTKETWEEFCSKYGLHLFMANGDEFSNDIYVNYDNCLIVKFKPKSMSILSVHWSDAAGDLHCELFNTKSLVCLYTAYSSACFPTSVNSNFTTLLNNFETAFHLLFTSDDNSINWEAVRLYLEHLKDGENSVFIDKVCSVIETKLAKDIEESAGVDVRKGEKVFRINVSRDSAYSGWLLTVDFVGDTYVGLKYNKRSNPVTFNTYRGNFWENFARYKEIEQELFMLISSLFKNVIDDSIFNAVLRQEAYKGNVTFIRYEFEDGLSLFCSEHFKICVSELDRVSVMLKEPDSDFVEHGNIPEVAEGFCTDVFLAIALKGYAGYEETVNGLFDFCKGLRDSLEKEDFITEPVSNLLFAVMGRVMEVQEFLINKEQGADIYEGGLNNQEQVVVVSKAEDSNRGPKIRSGGASVMSAFDW